MYCSSPSIHPAYNRLAKARKKRKFLNLKGFRSFFALIYESNIFTLKTIFYTNMYQICTKNVPDYENSPPMFPAMDFFAVSISIACWYTVFMMLSVFHPPASWICLSV